MTSFTDLGVAAPLARAVEAKGYTLPSPIQIQAIPLVLQGLDLMGLAQTGTGKTAAFALPILQRLLEQPRPLEPKACRVLVLAPTRELAAQIAASFEAYGTQMRLRVEAVFGGVSIPRQIRALSRGVDVLVATPGRLLDLVSQRAARLDRIDTLILDEADHMLDLGFIVPLRRIRSLVPDDRQTLLFSATMPKEIAELAGEFLRDPARVSVTPASSTPDRVAQRVIMVESASAKQQALEILLTEEHVGRALVFTRTKHGADRVVKRLVEAGFHANAIHGNKKQSQRERALADFRSGRSPILVATDIAARGIDVPDISHVVNVDLPEVPETYVHRIGRTARAGASGLAVSLVSPEELSLLRAAEKLMQRAIPGAPPAPAHQARPPHSGGRSAKPPARASSRPPPRRSHERPQSEAGPGREPPTGKARDQRPPRSVDDRREVRTGAPAGRGGAWSDRKGEVWSNQERDERPPSQGRGRRR